jgi:flagellar hook-basal body complex protein FliE
MIDKIIGSLPNIGNLTSLGKSAEMGGAEETSGKFADALFKGMDSVNSDLVSADKMATEHLTQGKHELHEVMIALEKADLSFRYMTQIRNKVIDAYQEVMRTQV